MKLSRPVKKWLYKTDGKWVALQAAIAMWISLTILHVFVHEFDLPFSVGEYAQEYAGLAVVVSAQPNISESLARGKERLMSTVFGGLVGILFIHFFEDTILNVSIAIFFIMYFLRMVIGKTTVLAAIIFIIIVTFHENNVVSYAIGRLLETSLGAVVTAGVGVVLDNIRKKFGIPDDKLKTDYKIKIPPIKKEDKDQN